MICIFKGDTANNLITVNISNPSNIEVELLSMQCGKLHKEYKSPKFPLKISLNREETKLLDYNSVANIAIECRNGEKYTMNKEICFVAKNQVVADV
jgi:hypothetical protein